MVRDVSEDAGDAALEAITSQLYFYDDPDPASLETLKGMNLLGMLQDEVGKEAFDMGRIKVIFRALKIAKPPDAIEYLSHNFTELIVFSKEMTLLMHELVSEYPGCFKLLGETVLAALFSPPASSIQLVSTWLIELFVRGTVPISAQQVKRLDAFSSPLNNRQRYLIRGRNGDQNCFARKRPASVNCLRLNKRVSYGAQAACRKTNSKHCFQL